MLTELKSPAAAARWLLEWTRGKLVSDSRQLTSGDAFIAWPGHARDGREFVAASLAAGASTCLVERDGVEAYGFSDARVAALPGLKAATGVIASAFYGEPTQQQLAVLAVTGTNGKTSTAWWMAQASSLLGQRCGVVGTLGVGEPGALDYTGLTTPDPVRLQQAFRAMADQGFAACAIEASSIGIVEHRLAGTQIRVALFTNFTQDHLDYHGSMDGYWIAKRQLFDFPGLQAAVLNIDDAKGAELAAELTPKLDVWTYALNRNEARISAHELHYRAGGLAFTLIEGAEKHLIETGLIGEYNVANLLGVIAGLRALGHSLTAISSVIGKVTPVPGRMQRVGHGRELPQAVVDYAHTPDALDKALAALRPLAAARGGELVVLFGCGGNRDKTKRPLMGAIAAAQADRVILASDNPRDEEPQAILDDIAAGMKTGNHVAVADRREGIRRALLEADARDVVLLAGKGHEDYQEVAGARHHFDDVEEARAALIERAGL